MRALKALETLYDLDLGDDLPLPAELAGLYGRLQFPAHAGRPYVIGNLATTLDGVAALDSSGHSTSREISGYNRHDRAVMGLLRAAADVIVVGAGTLRSVPGHIWTAGHIYRSLEAAYGELRRAAHKAEPPLNVLVTARGEVDPSLPVFRSDEVQVLIVTGEAGRLRLKERGLPQNVQVAVAGGAAIEAQAILEAIGRLRAGRPGGNADIILVEGGPHLLGSFCAQQRLDELFLTLAPQIAGRDGGVERPGIVAGALLAPEHPLWGRLIGIKREGSHLFLRYAFH